VAIKLFILSAIMYNDPELKQLQREISDRREKIVEIIKKKASPLAKSYQLYDKTGKASPLSDLFGDKQDLIVIHNMGKRCVYCTMWADEINGVRQHLEDRAALVLVSPDSPEVQQEFARSRGWNFQMYSDKTKEFTTDMGFAYDKDGKNY